MARVERVMRAEDLELVYTLVREHFERTGSQRAEQILDAWDYYRGSFWKVIATETALREPSPAPSEQPGARSAARA
jgi:glutamate synthase domain-containing protein 3